MSYKKQTHSGNKIEVSIIIPTFKSRKTIEKCLHSLIKQNYPKQKYEIIVVDNFSKDGSKEIAKKFKKVKFIEKKSNPAEARNYGAKLAKGSVLLFIDSDCIAPRNWIRLMTKNLKDNVVGVCGVYRNLNKDSIVSRYIQGEIEYRHKKLFHKKEIDSIGTYSAAYRRDVFLKFGGFDERFAKASGEDFDLSYRLKEAGYKLVLEPRAYVWHFHVKTLWKYLKQQFIRAYWRVLLYKKHPKKIIGDSYTGKFIPLFAFFMIFFWLSLLLVFVSILPPYLPILFLLGFYLLNIKFILYLIKKEKKMLIFAPPIIFLRTVVCLLGFFWGVIKIKR